MFNAHEAKRKTLINCECKDIMTEVERSIKNAIRNGSYEVSIPLHQFGSTPSKDVVDALYEELTSLGYKVDYVTASTLEPGFHPGELEHNFNSFMKIDWSLEEGERND